MGGCSCVLKLILGIVNSIFLLIGLALSAVGGILLALANNSGFSQVLEDIIKAIIENIGIVDQSGTNYLEFDFAGILRPAGIAILISGLVVLGVSIVGYVGLSCSNVVLVVYLIIIAVLLVIQVVLVGVFFSGSMNDNIRGQALNIIHTKYVGLTEGSIYSVGPNIIMSELDCCGLDSYEDFHESSSWVRNVTLKDSRGNDYKAYLETPEVCCRVTSSDVVEDFDCATKPNANNSNYEIGCWDKTIEKLSPVKTPAILISVAVIVVQAVLIIFVLIIVCDD